MRKNPYAPIFFWIMILFIGFSLGSLFRKPYTISTYGGYEQRTALQTMVNERNKIKELERELKDRQDILTDYQSEAVSDKGFVEQYQQDLSQLDRKLGFLPVQGPGIRIDISVYDDTNIAFLMEEKKLFLLILNILWDHSAEAIAINQQRIFQGSEIVLAGKQIHINQQPISPPYTMEIIGDQQELYDVLTKDDERKFNVVHYMKRLYQLQVDVKKEDALELAGTDRTFLVEFMTLLPIE